MRVWSNSSLSLPKISRDDLRMRLVCRLITPVFGGGVDARKKDPITLVRASGLRGALRFWWRATSALTDVEALRSEEATLFGDVHGLRPQASRVQVAVVRQPRRINDYPVFVRGHAFKLMPEIRDGFAYGAFPLRSQGPEKLHDVLHHCTDTFEVEIGCPAVEIPNLQRALWALFHFGGLGARVRRGFGALELESAVGFDLPTIDDGWPDGPSSASAWPTLAGKAMSNRSFREPIAAQECALNLLRAFRQGTLGRRVDGGRDRPGRSRWPEPDAIRALYLRTLKTIHAAERMLHFDKFPRAAFGAPIIFHFKSSPGEIEPPDTELVPRGSKPLNRLASSLLLRPHREPDGSYRALAIKLAHPPHDWALLEKRRIKADRIQWQLTPSEAEQIPALRGYSTDPVEAYLQRLSQI